MDVEYEALEMGRVEGREEGMQQGAAEEMFGIARSLLKINLPLDQISKAMGLTKRR